VYSGRITETGTVIETGSRLVIEAQKTAAGLSPGGSVNVNGTCVSAVQADGEAGRFEAEISAETAKRSTLGELTPGARVNLELPLRVGDALDGHLVQGHTDAVGKVTKVDAEHGGSRRVWIRPPKRFLEEIVAKGSVAVDGVSLTVAEVLADRFSVALIPVTLAETTLAGLRPDQRVNLESDLFVKSARDLWQSAHLAAGGGVLIYDPDREADGGPACRRMTGPRPSAASRTPTPRPPTSCAPVTSSPWPAPGGLAERAGHTEASLALCAAAGLPTVAAICEVMGPDGHMLTGAAVERFALAWSLPLISISQLAAHL
jgi:3,4-dihydroxy 2-butanone 4-phosphate synthase/3,4-dihydroxy 2-butanone 4-phosphate synthase/GTP cyclohydrolase II